MKKLLFICLSVLLLTSCNFDKEQIEFKKIDHFDLGNLSKENTSLKATAYFMNVSEEKCTLKSMVVDLKIDGKDIGTIVTKTNKAIQPNEEFSVPVKYSYETASFIEPGNEASGNYAVSLKGNLIFLNSKNKEISIPVKYESTFEYLTKKKERKENKEERKSRKEERRERKNNK